MIEKLKILGRKLNNKNLVVMVSNCPRCQIVLFCIGGVKLFFLLSWCQIVRVLLEYGFMAFGG